MILYDEDAQTLVRIFCPGSILAHLFQMPESPIIGFRAASTEFSTPSQVILSEAKNLNGRDAALRCPVGAARRPYHSGAPSDLCHPRTKNQRVGKPQHDRMIYEMFYAERRSVTTS